MNQDLQQLGKNSVPATSAEGFQWHPQWKSREFDPRTIDDEIRQLTPSLDQINKLVQRANQDHLQQWFDDDSDPFASTTA